MAADKSFTGVDRAAILLMSLGEEHATEILRHMGPKEVQKLGTAMAGMTNVSRTQVEGVLTDFSTTIEEQTALGIGSEDYLRSVLINALGEDKAGGIIDRVLMGQSTKGLEQLKWMDPRQIAELIRLEHPQIISIILAYLDPDQAAEVIGLFPEKVRPDIIMRIASLDGIQPSALRELDEIMERQFSGNNTEAVKSSSVGGIKAAAEILNLMEGAAEADILDKMKEVDADLSQQIQDNMFVFDNIIELDDRSIQVLLREISSESLILALKGADSALKEKIFKNMSKRAAEMMRDDLEAKGPVRLSEVETAQKEILVIVRRLAESGDISMGGKGDEFVG